MSNQDNQGVKAAACTKCGGSMLERGVGTYFVPQPQMRVWSNTPTSAMQAMVCDNCGYAEVYATNPEKLREKKQG